MRIQCVNVYYIASTKFWLGWIDQGRIAVVSTYLVKHREVFGLNPEMVSRAHDLMKIVRKENIPATLQLIRS